MTARDIPTDELRAIALIDGLLAHGVAYRDQLTDGHLLARRAAHGQLQR